MARTMTPKRKTASRPEGTILENGMPLSVEIRTRALKVASDRAMKLGAPTPLIVKQAMEFEHYIRWGEPLPDDTEKTDGDPDT